MPADMRLQVVACLLRRGRSLDLLSTGLTLLGVVLGLAPLLMLPVAPTTHPRRFTRPCYGAILTWMAKP